MLPTRTGLLDAAWLNDRLADRDDVGTIAEVTHESMGEGVGILGELSRLHLSYGPGETGPATMIAKCQSAFPENVGLCQAMGFYNREISFYQQLAGDVGLRVPRPYVAEIDPAGAPFVLVLEEITGARMVDQLDGADRADCETVLSSLAALHAEFWDSDRLDALEWLPPMNNDAYKAAKALGEAHWDGFVANWSDRVPARVLGWVEAVTPRYPEMLDWWADQGNATFAHIDSRLENFLFDTETNAVTVLDFQLATRHVGAFDVAYFLAQSVSTDNRRAWEQELLDRYHAELLDHGVSADYTRERFQRDYRYCLLQQAWAQLAVANLDPGNDRGRALLDAFVTRSFVAADDHDSGELLDLL
ncbi:MAG: oxidoreductase family protein [Actinomycetota bacterium]